jgi:hypothetical protein
MPAPVLTRIIDHACGPLRLRLERKEALPRRMLVHPEAFDAIAAIRRQEVVDGLPLMLLGLELAAKETVPIDGFKFED